MEPPAKKLKLQEPASNDLLHVGSASTPAQVLDAIQNLYMETVDRAHLDFDLEKLCSVTLSNLNIYACLVCGKYFSGRSKSTPAFFHSLEVGHHIFLNLTTLRAYILPDSFENKNPALNDIKHNVSPTFTKEQVRNLDKDKTTYHDFSRTPYRPGFVGMNNVKGSDHIGVVIHALSHVSPVRNFFLLEDFSQKSEMIQSFSLLLRRQWSSRLLKSHVSPHEFIRRANESSNNKKQGSTNTAATTTPVVANRVAEPQDFLTFLLNTFHISLGGSRTHPEATSIISSCFQGMLQVETQKVRQVAESATNDRLRFESDMNITTKITPFMFLSLDLPPTPLYQDDVQQNNSIPQVSLLELLAKYNQSQVQELPGERRRYVLTKLPPFLIFSIKRFKISDFTVEKNSTIVNFPLQNLDMSSFMLGGPRGSPVLYDLIVNISHESVFNSAGDESHTFKTQVRDKACDKWIQMEGLFVGEIKKDVISIGESVLQIWEKRK